MSGGPFRGLFILTGVLAGVFLVCSIIIFSVALTPSSCLKHHDYPMGANETSYCILNSDDDDLVFSFDESEDNRKRSDSTLYLLAPPFRTYRADRTVSMSFAEDGFKKWHYMLPGDTFSGVVHCNGECTVRVIADQSDCLYLNDNLKDSNTRKRGPLEYRRSTATDLLDLFFYLTECVSVERQLCKQKGVDTVTFSGSVSYESPVYVQVTGKSGKIVYTLSQTVIDTSNAIHTCTQYPCNISGLTGNGRDVTYLAINKFSEKMKGEKEMDAKYWVSKHQSINTSLGFGISTVVLLVATGVFVVLHLKKETDFFDKSKKSKNSGKPSQKSTPGADPEVIMQTL